VYRAFIGLTDDDVGAVSRTTAENKKAAALKKETKGIALLKGRGFLINLGITLVATALFLYLMASVSSDGEVNSFDPFSILEIDTGADMKTIKKAYRDKSLKFHPDKNPNNPAAEATFMMIAKAYEALTDETAKLNYEKYGNPDGKQSLAVSIGLPSFLLETSNRNLVLLAYLIIMVGVIPFSVYRYYSDSSKYGEKDVMYDTYSWYHHTLGEHTLLKNLPETFAGSAEFRQRNIPTVTEKKEITSLLQTLRAQMQKPKYNHPVCIKGNVLIHSHLLRQTLQLSEKMSDDLKYMLRMSNSLIDAMISVCQHQDSLQTAMNCIEFGQYVAQACWVKDSPLLQLPHFSPKQVSIIKAGAKTIQEYKALEEKPGMDTLTTEQKQDVLKTLHFIPDIIVESKVFVDDDEDANVYEGDLCTVKVTITRTNLEDGETAGLVHAPKFPYPKQEAWWVILGTKEGKIISIEKVTDPKKVVQHQIKFLAPRVGEYEFDLFVKSNAYLGLDLKQKVNLTTLDASALPEYKVHPDDAVLDDEPTLFEEMLNANVEQDSDSDDDDDDDDDGDDGEKEETPATAADKKKQALQKARKAAAAGDDDDSDDDEVEEVYAD
jgi:translocation protein SEC63